MKIFNSILITALLTTIAIYPQSTEQLSGTKRIIKSGIVEGIVVDNLTNIPIQFASFQLIMLNDTSKIYGTTSNTKGRFILKDIPLDKYVARISSVGYKKRKRNLLVFTERDPYINLDTISLAQKSIIEAEIKVTGKNEDIVYEKEKIILRVNKDLGDNGLELLENTPMVNVDIDGNVRLMGKQSTTIYIDGVSLQMAGFENAEDLKLLSVSDIDKVEIITNPSIEYAEAKNAGVINIVTKKKLDDMYSGNLSIGDNTRNDFSSNASFSYFHKAIIVRGTYLFNDSKYISSRNSLKTITLNDVVGYQYKSSDFQNNLNLNSGKFGIMYNPDQYNSGNLSLIYKSRNSENLQTLLTDQKTKSINNKNTDQHFLTFMANYKRTYSEKRKYLGLTLNYDNNAMNSNTDRNQTYFSNPGIAVIKNDLSDNLNNTLSWRSIFSDLINENTTYSIGYSGSYTGLTMENDYYYYDSENKLFNEDLTKKNHYKNKNTKHTLSGNFDSSIWGLDYTVRLEYEQYFTNFEENLSGNSFSKKYSYFLPGISIKKQIYNEQNIALHFNRSFIYPLNKQINQHVDYSDTTNIVTGNATLEPSYTNSLSLDYSYFAENIMLSINGAYSKQENLIEKITIQNNMTSAITTYQNIAAFNQLTATISARTKIFSFFKVDPSINWSSNEYLGQSIKNRSSSWCIDLRTSTSFKNFRFQLNFRYLSPQSSAQTKSAASYLIDAAVKMLFFDKQLSVSIKANDLFNTKNLNSSSYGNNFYSINGYRETRRIFSLNISYYFKFRANDDLEENKNVKEYSDDF